MAFPIDFKGSPRLKHIPISRITANPYQPRKVFDREGLDELADSIRQYGVITPLTVRKGADGYLLIAGERRLRASRLAGMDTVPCYIIEADDQSTSAMALVENLQRRDLDPFEEAEGLLKLTQDFGLTQQQAARQVGKTQAAVANKLRLLKLFPGTIDIIRQNHLTERHGRALLALEEEQAQLAAARYIVQKGLNVAQAEDYINRIKAAVPKPKPTKQIFIKDIRFFLNSVSKAVDSVKRAGINAVCTTESTDDGNICLTIVIPSQKA